MFRDCSTLRDPRIQDRGLDSLKYTSKIIIHHTRVISLIDARAVPAGRQLLVFPV